MSARSGKILWESSSRHKAPLSYCVHVFMRGGEISWIATRDATRGNNARVTALSARSQADVISRVDARMGLTAFRDRAEKFHRIKMHGKSNTPIYIHNFINRYSLSTLSIISFYKSRDFSRKKVIRKYPWTEKSLLRDKLFKNINPRARQLKILKRVTCTKLS